MPTAGIVYRLLANVHMGEQDYPALLEDLETYVKHINIEAKTAIQMVKNLYIPAVIEYTGELSEIVNSLKTAGASTSVQSELLTKISALLESATTKVAALESATHAAHEITSTEKRAEAFRDKVFPAQTALREDIDALETLSPTRLWPVPSYADMLFDL